MSLYRGPSLLRTCWLLVGLTAVGCSDDNGELELPSLAIEASDSRGRSAEVACETLPLLQGSRRYSRHIIDDRLTIRVVAEPAQVQLEFFADGRAVGKARTVPRGALLHGFAEELSVPMNDGGGAYTLHLSSGCAP